jgi:uncharacterized phiE125 gp8 family phage protein
MLDIVSQSAVLPVSLEDARKHLRRTDTHEDDDRILAYLRAALVWAENFTGQTFVDATYDLYLDGFPDILSAGGRSINLPKPPILEVQEIAYRDSGGANATFTDFLVDSVSRPGRVYLTATGSWPSTDEQANSVRIRYRAGYLDTDASPLVTDGELPWDIKAAVLIYMATLYEERELDEPAALSARPAWGAEVLLRMRRVENSMA